MLIVSQHSTRDLGPIVLAVQLHRSYEDATWVLLNGRAKHSGFQGFETHA